MFYQLATSAVFFPVTTRVYALDAFQIISCFVDVIIQMQGFQILTGNLVHSKVVQEYQRSPGWLFDSIFTFFIDIKDENMFLKYWEKVLTLGALE